LLSKLPLEVFERPSYEDSLLTESIIGLQPKHSSKITCICISISVAHE